MSDQPLGFSEHILPSACYTFIPKRNLVEEFKAALVTELKEKQGEIGEATLAKMLEAIQLINEPPTHPTPHSYTSYGETYHFSGNSRGLSLEFCNGRAELRFGTVNEKTCRAEEHAVKLTNRETMISLGNLNINRSGGHADVPCEPEENAKRTNAVVDIIARLLP